MHKTVHEAEEFTGVRVTNLDRDEEFARKIVKELSQGSSRKGWSSTVMRA